MWYINLSPPHKAVFFFLMKRAYTQLQCLSPCYRIPNKASKQKCTKCQHLSKCQFPVAPELLLPIHHKTLAQHLDKQLKSSQINKNTLQVGNKNSQWAVILSSGIFTDNSWAELKSHCPCLISYSDSAHHLKLLTGQEYNEAFHSWRH